MITREIYTKKCNDFLNELHKNGISKKQLLDIKFCFRGVENIEFGGVNIKKEKGKITNVNVRR